MPTNENTYNSRVTSEALEKKFRDVFPAQGGAELVNDLYASGVIQPVIDFSSVAEGSSLPVNLQTAWDFSTGFNSLNNTSTTIVSNTGFWKIDLNCSISVASSPSGNCRIYIDSGVAIKTVWQKSNLGGAINDLPSTTQETFVVFLRAGDSLVASASIGGSVLDVWYRQIADVNGNLVNPLGFTFS
jgi:hypothetical protein